MALGIDFDAGMVECRDCGTVYEAEADDDGGCTACPACCPACYQGSSYAGEGRPRLPCQRCGGTGRRLAKEAA